MKQEPDDTGSAILEILKLDTGMDQTILVGPEALYSIEQCSSLMRWARFGRGGGAHAGYPLPEGDLAYKFNRNLAILAVHLIVIVIVQRASQLASNHR